MVNRHSHLLKMLLTLVVTIPVMLSAKAQTTPIYIPQYHYIHTTPSEPWRGHSLLSLHAGSGFFQEPSFDDFTLSDYSPTLPFYFSLRYAGEKYIANRIFWGWHSEGAFQSFGFNYSFDGDKHHVFLDDGTSSAGHTVHRSSSLWTLNLEERLLFGVDLSYYFSLNLSAGIYCQLLTGGSTDTWFTHKVTGSDTPTDKQGSGHSIFSFGVGFSTQIELLYYITDNFFASCAVKANISTSDTPYSDAFTANQYSFLLGIGYKAYSNRHHDEE